MLRAIPLPPSLLPSPRPAPHPPWYQRNLGGTFPYKLPSKTSLICTTLLSFPEISWHIKSLLTTSTRLHRFHRSSIPFQNFKVNKTKLNFHGKQLEIGIEGKKENDIAIMITAHALHNKTPHIVYSFFLWVFNLFCVEVLHIILCLLLEPPEKLLLLKFQSVWFDLVEPTWTQTILNSRCKSFRSGRFEVKQLLSHDVVVFIKFQKWKILWYLRHKLNNFKEKPRRVQSGEI